MSSSPNRGPLAGHSPAQDRPLGGYAVLTASFLTAAASFVAWFKHSGRQPPEKVPVGDLLLTAVATQKLSRLVAKDRVTSSVRAPFTRYEGDTGHGEVQESARGSGLHRAIGELLVCPFCLAMWIAAVFTGGLLVVPRATRWIAFVLTAQTGADMLQIAYKKAEDQT